ncbi:DUF2946 domain-containing protein [Variovorax sp. ZS18.2.2]|uniref:DUF2946 domain-containing protein n=1 Tax=Variovorax sp. ZS18.2.2 TaxID=2971255 RepID=UPI0021510B4D|nr:DUF2946 domain-containing protein [Variovorax sp. ZS18.2.2]MCR6479821.1 DUF2946 domain-containing protein [Variovorax sp. ZS18.2.2]
MRVGHRLGKLISWIACVAVLMGSVAPVLSHAFQSSQGAQWIEVCTILGQQLVHVDDAAAEPSRTKQPGDHAQQHCPYCSSHAAQPGLAPASSPVLFVPTLRYGLPELFLAAPRTLFAWSTAQPRAPPRIS